MYLLTNGEEGLYLTLKKCCELPSEKNMNTQNIEEPNEEPTNKGRRKQCSRTMSVTAHAVFQSIGSNLNSQLNSANQNHTLYTRFKEQLITEGVIKWRSRDQFKDICIMTDYSSITGLLLQQSFAHVTAIKMDEGKLYWSVHVTYSTLLVFHINERPILMECLNFKLVQIG